MLAKMYKNKTGNDIDDDTLIWFIYRGEAEERVYFNSSLENYYTDFNIGTEKIEKDGKIVYHITPVQTTDFSSIKLDGQYFINIKFKDGTIGHCSYNPKTETWGKVEHYRMQEIHEPCIPKKFPDQHKNKSNTSEIDTMFTDDKYTEESETKSI